MVRVRGTWRRPRAGPRPAAVRRGAWAAPGAVRRVRAAGVA